MGFVGLGLCGLLVGDEMMDQDERFNRIDAAIERLSQHFTARFAAMDARFDAMDVRFDRLTQYVIEFRDESITRLDLMDGRVGLISSTLASIDPNSRLPALTKGVMDAGAISTKLALEISKQKTEFNARLAKLEETVAKLLPAA